MEDLIFIIITPFMLGMVTTVLVLSLKCFDAASQAAS
jgi:hypothetical protein